MADNQQRIKQLQKRLDTLVSKHNTFVIEVKAIQSELRRLTEGDRKMGREPVQSDPPITTRYVDPPLEDADLPLEDSNFPLEEERVAIPKMPTPFPPKPPRKSFMERLESQFPDSKNGLEQFIGENLISKIGILILIFGVVVGARYAIANNMVSPLTRVIIGYGMGLGLVGFALKLKEKYENFSAVLLSGAMAILYFITYTAYSFYELIPQMVAFALMVVFTAFTVVAALHYKRQIIAHLGLVGAYAVPFLLGDNSGDVLSLFVYMVIVNSGILFISFRQYWKPLLYVSFTLTWLIFSTWYPTGYTKEEHFAISLIFSTLFFVIFYVATMAYKLIRKEKIEAFDVGLLVLNAFIFYGLGYLTLEEHDVGQQLLGLFTVGNAVIHFGVAYLINRYELANRNLFHLIAGLVLVFLTLAIPVQLDGNWVTIAWAAEAALLFWLSRTKDAIVFERMSYVLMLLAFGSICGDWLDRYIREGGGFIPIVNKDFLSAIIVTAAFGLIAWLMHVKDHRPITAKSNWLYRVIYFVVPFIFLFVLYNTFRVEIDHYWQQLFVDSVVKIPYEDSDGFSTQYFYDLLTMKSLWILNYSMFFVIVLTFVNIKKIKNKYLGWITLVLMLLLLVAFYGEGNLGLNELRRNYLAQNSATYYHQGIFHLLMRYLTLGFVAAMIYAMYQTMRQTFVTQDLRLPIEPRMLFELVLHFSILFVLSTELIAWMDIMGSGQPHRLGLSILWGAYALVIISYGIWKNKKHLRLGGMALLTITVLKLFFYDLVHLDTIAKTILLVTIGILLLVISFLYNKFTNKISDDVEQ